jgi:hypothetical protein
MDLDLGDDPLYVRMAQAWIVGERDAVFQTLTEWPKSRAILGVVLISKALEDFDAETLARVNKQAETLTDLVPLLWHNPVNIDAALARIDDERWKRIDIAVRNLVYPGNDQPWETYEKLDREAKVNHLKHLRDIGKFHDLVERNRPNFRASFCDYLIDKLGLEPASDNAA